MDTNHRKLHLFGGTGANGQWLTLNMQSKVWCTRHNLKDIGIPSHFDLEVAKGLAIDGSLHLISNGMFLRYDRQTQHFAEFAFIDKVKHFEGMFYVKRQRRIYILGAHNGGMEVTGDRVYYDYIWYCQHNETFTEYKWHRLSVQLPYSFGNSARNQFKVVMAFHNILFLFYYRRKEVWFIDLVNERKSLCDKSVHIEQAAHVQMLVCCNDNVAHALCLDHHGPVHTLVRLAGMLSSATTPNEL